MGEMLDIALRRIWKRSAKNWGKKKDGIGMIMKS